MNTYNNIRNFLKKPKQLGLKALVVLASMAGVAAYGHGAWFANGTIAYDATTQALLNSNTAAGLTGFQNGNIVTVQGAFPVHATGTVSGPGGYITFYIPNGYEVVGASVTNASGSPISSGNATSPANGEGISKGWGPRGQNTFNVTANGWNPALSSSCTTFGKTAATCNNGLAFTYGDTGVFYSTRSDTAYFPAGQDISNANGYAVNPTNTAPWNDVAGGVGSARVHNKWDAVQSNAFGSTAPLANAGFSTLEQTALTVGRGSTPYLAGSPVAGSSTGSPLDRYATTGPWQRISYPGSCITFPNGPATSDGGTGADPVTPVNSVSACVTTLAGVSLSTSSPLPPATNAVRFAMGGIDLNVTRYVKLSLRVTNAATIGTINCEAGGSDSTEGTAAGNDNPWRYYVGAVCQAALASPATLSILKSVVRLNGQAYDGSKPIMPGAIVRYRVSYANNWTRTQSNVLVSDVLPAGVSNATNFTVVSGPNILPTSPTAPIAGGTTFNFQTISSLAAGAGGIVEFDATVTGAIGSSVTNTARVQSTQRVTPVTAPATFTVASNVADLRISKINNQTTVQAGDVSTYIISLSNSGPAAADDTILADPAVGALTKTGAVTCTYAGTPAATGPASPSIAQLEAGFAITTLPSGGSVSCSVNALVN